MFSEFKICSLAGGWLIQKEMKQHAPEAKNGNMHLSVLHAE